MWSFAIKLTNQIIKNMGSFIAFRHFATIMKFCSELYMYALSWENLPYRGWIIMQIKKGWDERWLVWIEYMKIKVQK